MTEDVKPALTADEWQTVRENRAHLADDIILRAAGCSIPDPDLLAKMIGICNWNLPADSQYKITRNDVAYLRRVAELAPPEVMRPLGVEVLAAKLAALLPPEP